MLNTTKWPPLVSSRARPRITSSSLATQPPPWTMTIIGRFRAPFGAKTSYLSGFTPGLAKTTSCVTTRSFTAAASMNDAPIRLSRSIVTLNCGAIPS